MDHINSYLSFRLNKEYYASSVSFVHNIIEYTEITAVPDMPSYMLGIINLRGQVLPVVDLRVKFGLLNRDITSNTCILVMEVSIGADQVLVGALVDGVSEVIEIEDSELKAPPSLGSKLKNDFITGVYHDDEKFILIMNMNRVFSEAEIIDLQGLAAEMS